MINELNKTSKKFCSDKDLIRSLIALAGLTNARIARTLNISEVYFSYIIGGQRCGEKVRRAIIREINRGLRKKGIEVEVRSDVLWPRKAA